jgi:hypothetical protein
MRSRRREERKKRGLIPHGSRMSRRGRTGSQDHIFFMGPGRAGLGWAGLGLDMTQGQRKRRPDKRKRRFKRSAALLSLLLVGKHRKQRERERERKRREMATSSSSTSSASLMCSRGYHYRSSPAFSSPNPPKTLSLPSRKPIQIQASSYSFSLSSKDEQARRGIWSMRQDLDLPSNAYAYGVSNNTNPKEKGPPPMVFERFQGVIDQLFHHVLCLPFPSLLLTTIY